MCRKVLIEWPDNVTHYLESQQRDHEHYSFLLQQIMCICTDQTFDTLLRRSTLVCHLQTTTH
jgi:hypothetical protein